MSAFLNRMNSRLKADRRLIVVYCVIYFLWGLAMNWIGIQGLHDRYCVFAP
ncbi:MAG: hypothetical protein WBG48_06450 [Pricia sp.]